MFVKARKEDTCLSKFSSPEAKMYEATTSPEGWGFRV